MRAALLDPPVGTKKESKREALLAKETRLVDRLNSGEAKIFAARQRGEDTSEWENLWIRLLREYEEVYDQLRTESEAC